MESRSRFSRVLKRAALPLVCAVVAALPATASATVDQYACCSLANNTTAGSVLRDGSRNARNTPDGKKFCLRYVNSQGQTPGYYCTYSGTSAQTDFFWFPFHGQCRNESGTFSINVSCWVIY